MWRSLRRPAVSIILAGLFLVLATGSVQYAHNHAHLEHEKAYAATPADQRHDDGGEANCFLHALMRAPAMMDGWTPTLICLGLFVAFLTMLASQPAAQKFLTRLDCRGPPPRLLIVP